MTIDDSEMPTYGTTCGISSVPRAKGITVPSTPWRLALYNNDSSTFNLLCLLTQLTTGTVASADYPVRVSSVSVYLLDDYYARTSRLKAPRVSLFPFHFCLFCLSHS